MKKKNIALFGGRFDPPHFGHLLVAEQVKEHRPFIDEVWLIPAFTHPWKRMYANPEDRLSMCGYLENNYIKLNKVDIDRRTDTYTIDTIFILKKKYNHKFFWVCGSDTIKDFPKWKDYKRLLLTVPIIVFPRDGYNYKKSNIYNFDFVNNHSLLISNYSSTIIRDRIRRGLSINGLVPELVEDYIRKNNLYLKTTDYV